MIYDSDRFRQYENKAHIGDDHTRLCNSVCHEWKYHFKPFLELQTARRHQCRVSDSCVCSINSHEGKAAH